MDSVFEIRGVPEVIHNLHNFVVFIRDQIAEALYQEALRIMAIAKERTPVKSGALRDSGRVFRPEITEFEISVTMSFGDEVVKYAIPVHERTYIRHIRGQSKFLESVILEEEGNILQNIGNRVIL